MSQDKIKIDIRVGILTVSDRSARRERPDESGPSLADIITRHGWQVVRRGLVPDDYDQIVSVLTQWADEDQMDVILTTGGTGFGPRDITPEATLAVLERLTPGIAEAMRSESLRITPHAMLSRSMAGIRHGTLIINLPGSPKAAEENLNVVISVLPHAVQLMRGEPSAEAGHRMI